MGTFHTDFTVLSPQLQSPQLPLQHFCPFASTLLVRLCCWRRCRLNTAPASPRDASAATTNVTFNPGAGRLLREVLDFRKRVGRLRAKPCCTVRAMTQAIRGGITDRLFPLLRLVLLFPRLLHP